MKPIIFARLTVMPMHIIAMLLVTTCFALVTASMPAHAYSTSYRITAPASAFVGNKVPVVSNFALEIANAPPGVRSVTETYSGTVSFGDGASVAVPALTMTDFGSSYFAARHAYGQAGTFTIDGHYNLHDDVVSCQGTSCRS